MASVAKTTQINEDSEMEEGEIVDELDELSDISSEEEFLLRQRLEVLEDYNNVLERTKRKRSTSTKQMHDLLYDLSEISAAELEEKQNSNNQVSKPAKHCKHRHKVIAYKKIEEAYSRKKKEPKKKCNSKRKPLKIISESSDESEDEYRNKRKKLADAVIGHRGKSDTTSLSARLKKMLHKPRDAPHEIEIEYHNKKNQYSNKEHYASSISNSIDELDCGDFKNLTPKVSSCEKPKQCEPIDIVTSDDDEIELITNKVENQPPAEPDSTVCDNKTQAADNDSEEDLAQLRQQVLSTKALKAKPVECEVKAPSDDEDSDTTELRLICLKSTLLKRAIEMKQKQKLHKRLSQTTLEDDILFSENLFYPPKEDSGNNTDIESMDMDMGSEDEKSKDDNARQKKIEADRLNTVISSAIPSVNNNEDELDEDEDLLRAKLLTSLSKNLPNLVSPEILNSIDNKNDTVTTETAKTKPTKVPEVKKFIIKLGDSDSEGEHEATKNLTKMHMKLSEPSDFQQKLDLFLKTTRKQVENSKLPDVCQKQATPKKTEKFIAKAVNHLPKSEQLEYKNLVRRMAELEKMKQLRQTSISIATLPLKDTMNPRNIKTDDNFEEKISLSRKKIADESAKMLKLKEEATKLTQKYKIVATELHNISTAITLNKKQQRAAQISLSKIRLQHQILIKSSSTLHSKVDGHFNHFANKVVTTAKSQKENTPNENNKNPITQKTVVISVVNDLQQEKDGTGQKLSVQVNVDSNTNAVKSYVKEKRIVEITQVNKLELLRPVNDEKENINVEKGDVSKEENDHQHKFNADDYKSPLDAFGEVSWNSDPNAILCPFEVGGQCKDPVCKYLHTQNT